MLLKLLPQIGRIRGTADVVFVSSLCLLLCQCDDGSSSRIRGLKDEIQTLNQQIDDTQSQVTRLQSQIESSRSEKKKLEEDKGKAQEEREAISKELEQLRKDFETYKTQYKLGMRKRAPGFPVQDFTSVDGKQYKQVVLREITETQVNFNHAEGIMKLHYKQLPEDLQAVLGFLIITPEQPQNTKARTAKQINAELYSDREERIQVEDNKVRDLRKEREKYISRQNENKRALNAALDDGKPVDRLRREIDQMELHINKMATQIMQAEVNLHRARSEKIKLLPEK